MATKLPNPPKEYDQSTMNKIFRDIEKEFDLLKQPAQRGYTVSNLTKTRTLNVSTATLTDVANFVGTLVEDLKAVGKLAP